ncbi:MAG: IPT/TIG domain-containing protein [Bdellovibrionota bacterium]|nr:IPT/TIG domain-containing protein [Bdellovibrionota bacterium]
MNTLLFAFILFATGCVVGEVQLPKEEASGAQAALGLTSVSPSSGVIGGGTTITLTGVLFEAGMTITIDGSPCASVTVINSTSATCVTPAHVQGFVPVSVATSEETSTLSNAFFYQGPPTISSISPSIGPDTGGSIVTLTGTNFLAGVIPYFDGVACNFINRISDTSLQCVPAAHASATVAVTVVNPDGQFSSPGPTYQYSTVPNPTSVNVNAGAISGGNDIIIAGTNFTGADSVTVAGIACASYVVDNPLQITCTTGNASVAIASGDIVVSRSGLSGTLASSYSYQPAPTITAISPSTANPSIASTITISGLNFDTVNGVSVLIDDDPCTVNAPSLTSTSFDCVTPTGGGVSTGVFDVEVRNLDGGDGVTAYQADSVTNGFTFQDAPAIGSITPNAGALAGGTVATISGTGFLSGLSATIGGVSCTSITAVTATSFNCGIPANASAGAVDVVVTNTDGQTVTATNLYTYQVAPSIASVTPNAGAVAGTYTIRVLGADFLTGATVSIGSTLCSSTTFINSGELQCVVPPSGSATNANVVVTNPDSQTDTLTNGFSYTNPPTIASISPAIGDDGGTTDITITGSNFYSSATVTIGALACGSVVVNSSTEITCRPPAQAAGTYNVTVTNADGGGQNVTATGAYRYLVAPTVSSVSPDFGPNTGGTSITVTGTNFFNGAQVYIGSNLCNNIVFVSSTTITCDTPSGLYGDRAVEVENVDGQSGILSSPGFLYVPPPAITLINPNNGDLDGGTRIVISGTSFRTGVSVEIGGLPCSIVGIPTSTSITCDTTGPATEGLKDLVITNTDGQSGTAINGFRHIGPPTITGVSPGIGPDSGGTTVTITGTNFVQLGNALGVTIGGANCINLNIVSENEINCETTAGPAGAQDIVITNGDEDQQTVTLTNGFTYIPPPTVTSVDIPNGPAAGGTTITVTGTNFIVGSPTTVTVGTFACTSVNVTTTTTLTCVTGAGTAGNYQITVENFDGQSATSALNIFTYDPAPTIASINRSTSRMAGGLTLTITGFNFVTTPSVDIEGDACVVFSDNPTSISCTLPGKATSGTYDVLVTNPDLQTALLVDAINYVPAPTVDSVAPAIVDTAGSSITITGSGFFDIVAPVVTIDPGGLNSICTSPVVGGGGTTITCNAPATAAGAYDLEVQNGDDDQQVTTFSSGIIFSAPPTIASITPANGPLPGGTNITISGTNFVDTPPPVITVGGDNCTNIVVSDPNTITCDTPAKSAGDYDVVITQLGSLTATEVNGFTYDPPPTVDSVSPVFGPIGGGTTLTITGTGFIATPSSVMIAGVSCGTVTWNSATEITCVTGAAATAGDYDITVTNPDAQVGVGTSLYEYLDPPSISNITPDNGAELASQAVTITGSEFFAPVTVTVGGQPCTPVTFTDSSQVSCFTDASLTGTTAYDVVITNGDGQTDTLLGGYTAEAIPTIASVDPATGTQSGGTNVTITGTNFEAGATVYFGAQAVSPTTLSATEITVLSPAGSPGAVNIRVVNPTAQEVTSTNAFTYSANTVELEWQVGATSPNPPNPDTYGPTSTNVTHTYTLKNVGSTTSAVITVSISGSGFLKSDPGSGDDCTTQTLAPGSECTVNVTFLGSFLPAASSFSATLNATDGSMTDTNDMNGTTN